MIPVHVTPVIVEQLTKQPTPVIVKTVVLAIVTAAAVHATKRSANAIPQNVVKF